MTSHQREMLDRLFAEAVALPPEQQAAFLAEHCPDPEVRDELQSLLAYDDGPALDRIASAIEHTAISVTAAGPIGQRLGPYRLTELIGEGGMSTVYRAVRDDDQFQQTVAIKLLRFSYVDPSGVQRFRLERQILASLEHLYIARLTDGGSWMPPGAAESQPYLVMEYVEGLPFNTYCEQEALSVRQRLMLFRQICSAVSYAHQQLVIHRDIKPANILVTSDGTPKLLDFGIAKLLSNEACATTMTMTSPGLRALTPDYASPEQVRGEPVSTLTDVYSLGAVLYELLTGCRPHRLVEYTEAEIFSKICLRDASPPSVTGGRQLRGDIDLIVMKAMQKQAARRYQSVAQFSDDIRCYLEGLPVAAQPDSLMYRAMKFVRRHRLAMSAIAAIFLALVAGIAASTWQALRASRAERAATTERNRALAEKQRADRESATAKAVIDFVRNDLLAQANPDTLVGPETKPDPNLTVRTAVDRSAARIAGKFSSQPEVEASIRHTIGQTYEELDLLPQAREQLEQALKLRRRALGEEDPLTLQSMNTLAGLYVIQREYKRGETLLVKTLEIQRRVLGQHLDTADTLGQLGNVYTRESQYARAESCATEALGILRKLLGEEHPETLTIMNNLAVAWDGQGKTAEAEALYRNVLEVRRRVLGEAHPRTVMSMSNLASLVHSRGKYDEAEALLRTVVETRRRVLGETHTFTLMSVDNLGAVCRDAGKYALAEELLMKALHIRLRTLGQEHEDTLNSMNNLGILYRDAGRNASAESFFLKTLELRRRILGEEHPETLSTMYSLGTLYGNMGKYDRAVALLNKALAGRRRLFGDEHPLTNNALAALGRVRLYERKYREAEELLRTALANYEKRDRDSWERYSTQSKLGASLAGQKKYAEAEQLLVPACREMLKRQATVSADRRAASKEAGDWIIRLYQDWGKPEKAAEWREILRGSNTTDRDSW